MLLVQENEVKGLYVFYRHPRKRQANKDQDMRRMQYKTRDSLTDRLLINTKIRNYGQIG